MCPECNETHPPERCQLLKLVLCRRQNGDGTLFYGFKHIDHDLVYVVWPTHSFGYPNPDPVNPPPVIRERLFDVPLTYVVGACERDKWPGTGIFVQECNVP